jgi:radical SAM superfamily enzyme YgiQ (UPF0313 family)
MYELLLVNIRRQYDFAPVTAGDWLGVYGLAAFLEQNGHSARVFVGYAHEFEKVLDREMANDVDVVGFSCDYENRVEVEALARLVKQKWGLPVIVGGPQSVALDSAFLRRSLADVIVRGEGELPLLALMNHYVDNTGSLQDIGGLIFLENGREMQTPRLPLIENLDALPYPDPKLTLGNWFRRTTASFLTSRGCPFSCAFCYEGGNTRRVRFRSVRNVMDEVRKTLLDSPHVRYVLFTDDTFTLDVKRLKQFTDALSALRRERDFGWFAEAHPSILLKHPEMLEMMCEAGLCTLQIGIESGSDEVLKAYGKKADTRMVREAVRLCVEAGVPHVAGNFIVGGALETEETFAASLNLGLELIDAAPGAMTPYAVHYWPMPGTAMTTHPEKFGIEIIDPDSLTSVTDYPVIRTKVLTTERLSCLRHEMEQAFSERITTLTQRLTEKQAMNVFTQYKRYGNQTSWLAALSLIERLRKYCALSHDGAIRRFSELSSDGWREWHPQRTCAPRVVAEHCFAGDIEIDRELYRFFVACSGRQTSAQIMDMLGIGEDEFAHRANILERLMALGFCRY